jgi:N-acetylneuraminic acid mutarotase
MAMPTARDGLAAVAGRDGMIYAIGGLTENGSASGVVEVYDPTTDSWTTRRPMPTPRSSLAAVLGSDGKIYALGGDYASVTDAGVSIVVQVYDPVADAWQTQTSLPVGRTNASAAVDASGTIYAIGGFDGVGFQSLGSVVTRTASSAAWSPLSGAMTTARFMHASAVASDGNIYVVGGTTGYGEAELDALEYHEPGATGWHTLPKMPTPRKWLGAAAIGAQLYAIGGSRYNGAGLRYTNVVEAFDTGTQSWTQVTSIPNGRFGHVAVALGGKVYVIRGVREDTDHPTATVDVFTPDP